MEFFGTALHWFSRGGFVMYLLLLASLGTVTIIIERARYYRRHRENLQRFLQRWRQEAEAHSLSELAQAYAQREGSLSRLTAVGCRAAASGRRVGRAIEAVAQLEAARLRRGLPLLGCLVTLSPLLGLMGTIYGMIQSFRVFDVEAGGAPLAITGGIGEALVATLSGLGVAVIALLGHSWFGDRLDGIVTDMEQLGTLLAEELPERAARAGGRGERGLCKHEAA